MIGILVRLGIPKFDIKLSILIAIAVSVIAIVTIGVIYLTWKWGSVQIAGIPLQIVGISIVLPAVLALILSWFAKKQDQITWQNDDEE